MIEEDFYATIKLKTGEEIFAKVLPSHEEDKTLLLINNPVVISEYKSKNIQGYKMESWLKTTTEDLFIINLEDVLTMIETRDIEMISMYQNYLNRISISRYRNSSKMDDKKVSRKMGYISNIEDAKNLLENIFKNS